MARRILISTDPYEARAVLMEGDRLVNIEVESASAEKRKGHIYRGRVTAIEPSLEAAFVDYGPRAGSHRGASKDGFLPFDEVATRSLEELTGHGRARNRSGLRVGDAVLVQVSKEEVGRKGATLTMFVSLPGRYVVLMPFSDRTGVSRKLDGDERDRLRRIMRQVRVPEGFGVIMRTSGEMTESPEEVQADLDYLVHTWEGIVRRFREATEPGEVYSEAGLAIRFVRDYLGPDVTEVLVEDAGTMQELSRYLQAWMPHRHGILKRYEGEIPLFTRYGVERQIEALMSRRVTLPSGGSIVIGETEALVAIDVNSGRLKQRDAEGTALATNLEAAREVARQVVLRDLGGIIVVDFIDMESEAHRRRVEDELKAAMARDKARLSFGRITDFGLLAFSRQRIRQAMDSGVTLPCPTCSGTGRLRSPSSLAMTALRRVRERLATLKQKAAYVEVVVPVAVANFLNNRKREDLTALERRYGVLVDVTGDPNAPPHDIRVNVLPEVPADRTFLRSSEEAPPAAEEPEATPEPVVPQPAAAGESRERSVLKGLLKIVFGMKDEEPATQPAATPVAPPGAPESPRPPVPRRPAPGAEVAMSAATGGEAKPEVQDAGGSARIGPAEDDAGKARAGSGRRRSGRGRRRSRGAPETPPPEARSNGDQGATPAPPEAERSAPEQAGESAPGTGAETPRRSRRRRGGRRRKRSYQPMLPIFEGPAAAEGSHGDAASGRGSEGDEGSR